jgi:hypothetical protein
LDLVDLHRADVGQQAERGIACSRAQVRVSRGKRATGTPLRLSGQADRTLEEPG